MNMSANEQWYDKPGCGGQGLVISEADGRNVAVAYDAKDAPLLAAAPDLLAACITAERFISDAPGVLPGCKIVICDLLAAIEKAVKP